MPVPAVPIADPSWEATFPHRVAPRAQEGLAGLVLRCDEANGWDSGVTLTHLLRATRTEIPKEVSALSLALPSPTLHLHALAGWLGVSEPALLATTYRVEVARLYANPAPHSQLLDMAGGFQFCPACVAEGRMLRRTLALPHLRCCPLHQLQLHSRCTCRAADGPPQTAIPGLDPLVRMIYDLGAVQRVFSRGTKPFTCRRCGLDWARFPRLKADPERLILEQKILAWYDFFFRGGTPVVVARALRVIDQTLHQRQRRSVTRLNGRTIPVTFSSPARTSLGHLVDVLVSLDLSPADVAADDTPRLRQPLKRHTVVRLVPAGLDSRPTAADGDAKT